MLDWEFEKAGREVKVSPSAKLVATHLRVGDEGSRMTDLASG